MLSKKDKKTISTKYWNGGDKFVHPTVEHYTPHGNFHDFDGLERQLVNETKVLIVMTVSEEGFPSLVHLNYNYSKKMLVV